MGFFHTDCEGFHRRDFIKLGSAGLLGLTLPDFLRLEAAGKEKGKAAKAKSVILVWLAGGPASIDMWDLKPDAPETIRGEFKPIDTSVKGLQISEHLPKTAQVMHHTTLIRSIAHTVPAHEVGTIWMTTGNKPTPALQYPSLGSVAAKMLDTPTGVPAYVSMSNLRGGKAGGPGYLGAAHGPFEVEGGGRNGEFRVRGIALPKGFAMSDLDNRHKLLEELDASFKKYDQAGDLAAGLDQFQQKAIDILHSDRTKKAFDLLSEKESVRAGYGTTPFGSSALAARRLVEAGVRFVTIGTGGWDTHRDNFKSLKDRNLPQLDSVLSALISDLAERGMLDDTIVMCAGEFGRTPTVNKTAGRDHWARSMAVVVAGGAFKRGHVHGATDEHGKAPATEPCSPDDLAATIFHQLGIDPHKELMTSTKRPIQLFREGKVLTPLLG
jgi:hypothetical protein